MKEEAAKKQASWPIGKKIQDDSEKAWLEEYARQEKSDQERKLYFLATGRKEMAVKSLRATRSRRPADERGRRRERRRKR